MPNVAPILLVHMVRVDYTTGAFVSHWSAPFLQHRIVRHLGKAYVWSTPFGITVVFRDSRDRIGAGSYIRGDWELSIASPEQWVVWNRKSGLRYTYSQGNPAALQNGSVRLSLSSTNGRVQEILDTQGRTILSARYSPTGNIVQLVLAAGTSTFRYNSDDQLTHVCDERGQQEMLVIGYDEHLVTNLALLGTRVERYRWARVRNEDPTEVGAGHSTMARIIRVNATEFRYTRTRNEFAIRRFVDGVELDSWVTDADHGRLWYALPSGHALICRGGESFPDVSFDAQPLQYRGRRSSQ